MLLGDFNRRMDNRDELLAALSATAPLARATEGRGSPCWGGNSFIDHILAGGAARGWMQADTLRVMLYRETEADGREAAALRSLPGVGALPPSRLPGLASAP